MYYILIYPEGWMCIKSIYFLYSLNELICMFKDIGLQFYFFFHKIYSLCKNNALSKVLNKLQAFYFRGNVHTNPIPTVKGVFKGGVQGVQPPPPPRNFQIFF